MRVSLHLSNNHNKTTFSMPVEGLKTLLIVYRFTLSCFCCDSFLVYHFYMISNFYFCFDLSAKVTATVSARLSLFSWRCVFVLQVAVNCVFKGADALTIRKPKQKQSALYSPV